MDLWQAIVLRVIEGLTEFLPVSSTGRLTIAEQLNGQPVDDPAGVTAFPAVIQLGTVWPTPVAVDIRTTDWPGT